MKRMVIGGLALSGSASFLGACARLAGGDGVSGDRPRALTEADRGILTSAEGVSRLPAGEAIITIEKIGEFTFDAGAVETVRPDVFRPGHYSLFDILVHLGKTDQIALDYHFDERADTHVIDAINGTAGWWHQAYYDSGWPEASVIRMDHYPYKLGSVVRIAGRPRGFLDDVHAAFRREVARLTDNGGQVVIPQLDISSPAGRWSFEHVEVTPHDTRPDMLQPGAVTALDALLSLREQGKLPRVGLTWYKAIGPADPVDSYWVEMIGDAVASGGCGFVYETGPRQFSGFSGSHIHIPADVRVTVSPEYALWFWICLGRGF